MNRHIRVDKLNHFKISIINQISKVSTMTDLSSALENSLKDLDNNSDSRNNYNESLSKVFIDIKSNINSIGKVIIIMIIILFIIIVSLLLDCLITLLS